MKLAFVHNRPIDAAEANVAAVVRMAEAFARAGRQVELTTYGAASAQGEPGDPFLRHGVARDFRLHLEPVRRGPLSYPRLVGTALVRSRPGRVVVYTRIPQIALYAMLLGRRVVLEMHTPIGVLRQGERLRRMLDLAASRLQGLVVISPALDAALREELPAYRGPRVTAPSAAPDFALSGPPRPDHDLGYVGGLNPGKGAEFVLELAARLPGVRVLIAGDVGRRPDFVAQAAALANVTLVKAVAPADVAAVMARFRIGLAPYARSVTGSGGGAIDLAAWMSPLKLAEYASASKAIVASRLPAVEAMMAEGRELLLAPPQDLAAWTAILQRLLATPAEVDRLGAAARAAYEARLSWDARARTIIAACGLEEHG